MATHFADHLLEGDHGSRPAAGDVPAGTLYSCTTHTKVYQSDGSSTWSDWFVGAAASAAADVTFDPSGLAVVSASNVQDAIEELDAAVDGIGGAFTPAAARFIDTGTHANYTTNSTSFGDVDGTNLSLTISTGNHRCLVMFTGMASNSGGSTTAFDIDIDGSRQGHATLGLIGGNNGPWPVTIAYMTAQLSAASHTFKLQWKVSAGTGTLFAHTTGMAVHFSVVELGV